MSIIIQILSITWKAFQMRMSQEEKEKSHERIIANAARLFREHGIEGASVSDVMSASGLTHGGFYKHFESKDALLGAALDRAFDEMLAIPETLRPQNKVDTPSTQFQTSYLSDQHVSLPAVGCPIVTLGGEIARGSVALKVRFGNGVRRMITLLSQGNVGSKHEMQARATRELAMMVGAVLIARATDSETAREVLSACRERFVSGDR